MQEAVTDIGVERIVEFVKEHYVRELNEEYFGFSNSSIRTMLARL